MGMKTQDIYDLMDRFEASGIARLKLKLDGCELELERAEAVMPAAPAPVVIAAPAAAPVAAPAPAAPVPAAADAAPAAPVAPASDAPAITAPLVGTFYVAPAPDKDPYVQPGDRVRKGDTVCLLEAMKMMSEVTAPCDCVIEEIVAADGSLVEYGAPLIRYREA